MNTHVITNVEHHFFFYVFDYYVDFEDVFFCVVDFLCSFFFLLYVFDVEVLFYVLSFLKVNRYWYDFLEIIRDHI